MTIDKETEAFFKLICAIQGIEKSDAEIEEEVGNMTIVEVMEYLTNIIRSE